MSVPSVAPANNSTPSPRSNIILRSTITAAKVAAYALVPSLCYICSAPTLGFLSILIINTNINAHPNIGAVCTLVSIIALASLLLILVAPSAGHLLLVSAHVLNLTALGASLVLKVPTWYTHATEDLVSCLIGI